MLELPRASDFIDSLLAGRSRDAIGWVLECVAGGIGVTTVHRDLVLPCLVEIGTRWESGAMTVADEHYCSAALHSLLARMHAFLPRAEPIGRRVVVVGVAGNLHALSLHMLADQYEIDGWEATLVGANTPVGDIVAIATRLRADVVAIGATLDEQREAVVESIRAIREAPELAATRVVIGGRATAAWDVTGLGCDAILDDLWTAPARTRALFATPRSASVVRAVEHPPAVRPATNSVAALAIDNAVHERALSARNLELQHADEAKNKLIGMAAHELRNPLTVVLTGLQFLDEINEENIDEDVRQTLVDMRMSTDRMRRLVQDLLDITRADSRSISLDIETCDAEAIVDDAVAAARNTAVTKQIVIVRPVRAARVAPINADPQRIRQVVDNYLTNAIKFSPPGSSISIDVTVDGGQVRIAVTDAGPGVPPHERARLFKPFSRTSVRPTGGESSTGLGLAIVARIVAAHRGAVGMQDGQVGGSEFWFALPLAESAAAAGLRATTRVESRVLAS